ncbi:MAG: replication restart helicase PriA [Bacteroidota bacterium]
MARNLFADVILPLALDGGFSYRVPEEFHSRIAVGMRVEVQFGRKRIYTALVRHLHSDPPTVEAKDILSLLDDHPLVNELQIQFWDWISDYYMCTTGEVMNAALPAGLKPESESRVRLNPGFREWLDLTREEQLIMDVVETAGEITIEKLAASGKERNLMSLIRSLVEKQAIVLNEVFTEKVKQPVAVYVVLNDDWKEEKRFTEVYDALSRAPRQQELLAAFSELSGFFSGGESDSVERSILLRDRTAAALNALVKRGLFRFERRERTAHPEESVRQKPKKLSTAQSKALESIREQHRAMQTVLLYGVTSSGKTELYIHLIRETIRSGKQALYLLPEIALTTQIIARLKNVFGDEVGIYHSRFTDAERVRVYRNLAGLGPDAPYRVILGVRSAVFLPFRDLGLVIVDEEHESTFKQFDPAPRYHARDSVNILAMFHNAKVLLGSATPSFESWYNVKTGKYGLVRLDKRYGDTLLPAVILSDVREATRKKQMQSLFTPLLLDGIREAVGAGKQVILFQNRRGYSNYLWCPSCNYIPRCKKCDVSLTYHKHRHELVCHYCGGAEKVPPHCPDCGDGHFQMKGFGTEKVEDELGLLIPGIRVARLDTDVARSRSSYERIISEFSERKLDVLVGTQLVSKGLDFEHVTLVGILDADSMMNFPDFRAFERSFQLMMQVSGRAGRREEQGKVIIQTGDVAHPVILNMLGQDYERMFEEQMPERKQFSYPPYTRLIRLTLRHQVPSFVDAAALYLAGELKSVFGPRVLGPQPPSAGRRYGLYHQEILVKIERNASFERARQLISGIIGNMANGPVHKAVKVIPDVDPY